MNMNKRIFEKLKSILENRWFSRLVGNLTPILPISKIRRNILLNKIEISKGKEYLSSYPYKGVLNLTDACNLRCRFCEIHYVFQKYPIQYKNFINLRILKGYYPLLSRMKSLAFYGATGEPLLNPNSSDIIRFLKNKNPEIFLSVNTNGLLLTDRNIRAMVEVGFDGVLISIHSASKKAYQYLVGGNYDNLIKNIGKLAKEKNEQAKEKPRVGLTFALSKLNAKDAIKYPELGKKLKVDYININHYYDVRNQLSEEISFYFSPKEGNEILQKVYNKAKEIGIKIVPSLPPFLPEDYDRNTNLLAEYNKQIIKKNWCFDPFTTLKFKGCAEHPNSQYVTVCNRILLLRINYEKYDFKDLHKDIWNHPTMLYIRSTVNESPYNPICSFCRNRMTSAIRCLSNPLYRELRDKAVEEFFKSVKANYQIPKINGIETLENNPYE